MIRRFEGHSKPFAIKLIWDLTRNCDLRLSSVWFDQVSIYVAIATLSRTRRPECKVDLAKLICDHLSSFHFLISQVTGVCLSIYGHISAGSFRSRSSHWLITIVTAIDIQSGSSCSPFWVQRLEYTCPPFYLFVLWTTWPKFPRRHSEFYNPVLRFSDIRMCWVIIFQFRICGWKTNNQKNNFSNKHDNAYQAPVILGFHLLSSAMNSFNFLFELNEWTVQS